MVLEAEWDSDRVGHVSAEVSDVAAGCPAGDG